ncbi:bifunctional 2-polyprenyl-6-hydroxyphenol methylase/3-demethylubiquinol 3-O-methyltransferase UbiG [Mycobacterium sp. 1423905.2]|uniref:class I SAM-dependent methyltransferase n=1 Tax=Mycobacterium sp. 1423905.2 TaxID=1856859 RepID=UPI0007FE94FC|nr:class I SAM-dependent methyltransferase [Mycobacterium sp. 1423905.2]OBJ54298.1 methyltransferase type 12 [Mycobacterium sp. 1423905.2]
MASSDDAAVHTDRRRASSFGVAAEAYDRYRPRYPDALITDLVAAQGATVLDVGAGTGIASEQLSAAGAEVLAVEPDDRMASVAADKGIAVERSDFEHWEPAGRTFDMVVFAQSFHWVEPRSALRKIGRLLRPNGRLALVWNRIIPITPSQAELDEGYAAFLDTTARPSVHAEDELTGVIEASGFRTQRRTYATRQHYSADQWLNMVFTYSNHLLLPADAQARLRADLYLRIGPSGVSAENDALAIVCAPAR